MVCLTDAFQRVVDLCNLEGSDSDIYNNMYKYKIFRDMTNEEQEEIYNEIGVIVYG